MARRADDVTGDDATTGDDMTASRAGTDRWDSLDFGPPADGPEPDEPVLVDYVSDGRIAVITLNRPHADNAITTEMGARLTEILETIAVRQAVRVAILTGAASGRSRSAATCASART